MREYDCIIVGGGLAGLQAAIQMGRYSSHRVLVVDAGEGRSTLCRTYHNILGFPDGVSGEELRSKGRMQAEQTGVNFEKDRIIKAGRRGEQIQLFGSSGSEYMAKTVLLATGLTDRIPAIPGLRPTLGRTVYVCPDCDGYEIQDQRTILLGAGEAGANMAMVLIQRTNELLYINHEQSPISAELHRSMKEAGVRYLEAAVQEVQQMEDGHITGVLTEDGQIFESERGFVAFGGNRVHYELAEQLGAVIADNKHVEANARSMQAAPNVWIAGDLGLHAEQATVAMGEGSIAAIWIHKALQQMKKENKVKQI
ncbi:MULTISPECIES: NAD(P)/FAD-dependent oxidoreductase [unclassified Paenibacillus]|uniref:NAD(P)/FAD-dependent oxidoreductase n=1 Tax=Paenibacillus TaxID=44249 RepID=UPI0007BEE9EE|nr:MULTISPECIES: NAD(P)/FAD-dependent oxidoreductase [unclassified Paenibacillus]OAX49377.1 Thioredoxin reductase [Paenibacillus sp. AD87]SLJ96622.1 Thioredoxin reductase [Paenibacillus sp. RU5A]SOC67095.1 Thioredoxin reductase [Paenibacillus sp. RU26A]SOC69750.1 Thioredoxin reductase [Paenibacillus sp. RU5M]